MIQKLRRPLVSADMVRSRRSWRACKRRRMHDSYKPKKWAVNLSDTGVLLSRICTLLQEVFYRTSAAVVPAVKLGAFLPACSIEPFWSFSIFGKCLLLILRLWAKFLITSKSNNYTDIWKCKSSPRIKEQGATACVVETGRILRLFLH